MSMSNRSNYFELINNKNYLLILKMFIVQSTEVKDYHIAFLLNVLVHHQ